MIRQLYNFIDFIYCNFFSKYNLHIIYQIIFRRIRSHFVVTILISVVAVLHLRLVRSLVVAAVVVVVLCVVLPVVARAILNVFSICWLVATGVRLAGEIPPLRYRTADGSAMLEREWPCLKERESKNSLFKFCKSFPIR